MYSLNRKQSLYMIIIILMMIFTACNTPVSVEPTTAVVQPTETLEEATEESTEPATAIPTESEATDVVEATDTPEETATETKPTPEQSNAEPNSDLDETFQAFWQTWALLDRYYVEQPLNNELLAQGAIDGILSYSDTQNVIISTDQIEFFSEAADTPNDLEVAFAPFWETWISTEGENDNERMQAALSGMVDSLGDQHTSYMDPDQFIQANIPIDGTYEGIGAWVDANDEYLTIVSPMPGSPAEAAGLKPGDQIIKVDGEDMTGIDGNLVIRRVLGPAGTEVTLTVRREGVEEFDVVIVREKITIPSLAGEILAESNLAYVQLFTFAGSTGNELRDLLRELLAENPDGLIFDLRNNGGGLLVTAVEVASEFIPSGVILSEEYGDDERDVYEALPGGVATEIPMVVLVNEGSASASEIVAGAIQDYDRAILVGSTTFGKGSVQSWIPLLNEGAVRITIARWLTPNNRQINDVGLTPDVIVELTEEDFNAGLDPQLDKAIELLTTE